MRIILATAHPYLPEISGGAQSSINEMALSLLERGHRVAVLSGLAGDGVRGFRQRVALKLGKSVVVRDDRLGYPVFRSWEAWEGVPEATRAFHPDVAVPHSGLTVKMSRAFERSGIPSVPYYRNVEASDFGGDPASSGSAYLANSHFTARRLANRYGIDATVIPPLFDAERYRSPGDGRYVTFINPHPDKGRDLAFALARACPDLSFLFVRAWTLSDEDDDELLRLERDCPNVTLLSRTDDMRSIYARTRVLLMPSRWEEAWGRTATEAQFSGIPVLATAIGGLPESVGPGGILLAPEAGVAEWTAALRTVIDDAATYRTLSGAALAHADRAEIDRIAQTDCFVAILEKAIEIGIPAENDDVPDDIALSLQ